MHDSVQLSVVADRGAVAELIARHLPELRQALEAQGLQLDAAEVDVREREQSSGSRSRDWAAEERSGGRDRDDGPQRPDLPPLPGDGSLYPHSALRSLGAVDIHV